MNYSLLTDLYPRERKMISREVYMLEIKLYILLNFKRFFVRVTEDTQKNMTRVCSVDWFYSHRPAGQETVLIETDELLK
jgi:hypothetical protein